MNQLAVLNKHLRLAGEANAKIKGVESRKKANSAIREFAVEVGGFSLGELLERAAQVTVQVPSVITAIPESLAVCSLGDAGQIPTTELKPVEADRTTVDMYRGNPVLEPITDYEVKEVVGEPVTTEPPPEMRDGFPIKATITVASRCINPKLLAGRLGDGRQVSVERGFRNWKVGDSVECELLRSGGQVLYRQIGTRI